MRGIKWITVFFAVSAFVLLMRLCWLQIFSHEELVSKADRQDLCTVTVSEDLRGVISDRNGTPITAAEESSSLLVIPSLVEEPKETAAFLSSALSLSAKRLEDKMTDEKKDGTVYCRAPFWAKTNLSEKERETLSVYNGEGLLIVPHRCRHRKDLPALHLLGTLETDKISGKAVGTSGLERIYDDVLSGEENREIRFLIDEKNRNIADRGYFVSDTPGSSAGTVVLTLDLDIQRAAEASLGDRSGAVVVLDTKSGDVLAMASSPKYDPLQTASAENYGSYMNKALLAYPPASLFKVFLSAVALEEGIVSADSSFFCEGGISLENGATVHCWKTEGHGFLTFDDALSQSCNPVFVKTVQRIGIARLRKAFEKWELNKDYLKGYPLDDRSSFASDAFGAGDEGNIALGENGITLTPLNAAKMINVIATGGLLYTPRLVKEVRDREGNVVSSEETPFAVRVISEKTANTVKDMMSKTFSEGTAAFLGLNSFGIAGKTGSSETGSVWIGGFFPKEDPAYTVVVLVEKGNGGATDAGPIFKRLCAYLGNTL